LLLEPNSPALMNEAATRETGGAVTASTRTSLQIGDREISLRTIVFVLMLLTFALRIAAAAHLDVICSDGAYYIQCATALESGDLDTAFQYRSGRNIYLPFLLAAKIVVGDFEMGGKFLGVIVATLTVLPLWGLFRRLFDDRIAAVACFLYGVHPSLIKWAVEPIRDPIYWLFFTLALYFLERARHSQALCWFVAASTLTALSVLTRTEGWLLLVPAMFAAALPLLKPLRNWSATARSVFVIVAIPVLAFAVLLNYTVRERDALLLNSVVEARQTDEVESIVHDVAIARSSTYSFSHGSIHSPSKLLLRYVEKLVKAYSPGIGLLCLIGLVRNRRILLAQAHFATAVMNILLLFAIGFYLWRHGEVNTRYYMPVLICSLPFAALQLLKLPSDLASFVKVFAVRPRYTYAIASLLLMCSAINAVYRVPEAELVDMAELGRYLRAEYGDELVLASFGSSFTVSHYASPRKHVGLVEPPNDSTWHQLNSIRPDVIVLQGRAESVNHFAKFLDGHAELGFKPVDLHGTLRDGGVLRLYSARSTPTVSQAPSASAELKR
jgi:hypothetical protein